MQLKNTVEHIRGIQENTRCPTLTLTLTQTADFRVRLQSNSLGVGGALWYLPNAFAPGSPWPVNARHSKTEDMENEAERYTGNKHNELTKQLLEVRKNTPPPPSTESTGWLHLGVYVEHPPPPPPWLAQPTDSTGFRTWMHCLVFNRYFLAMQISAKAFFWTIDDFEKKITNTWEEENLKERWKGLSLKRKFR